MTPEHAREEAETAIRKNQIWVAQVTGGAGCSSEIVCMVAVQRSSHGVATITKTYTNVAWRRRGIAEALINCVCERSVNFGLASGASHLSRTLLGC